jgi:hypothetical protein
MSLLFNRSDVADLLPIEACIERAMQAGRGVKIDLAA